MSGKTEFSSIIQINMSHCPCCRKMKQNSLTRSLTHFLSPSIGLASECAFHKMRLIGLSPFSPHTAYFTVTSSPYVVLFIRHFLKFIFTSTSLLLLYIVSKLVMGTIRLLAFEKCCTHFLRNKS